MSCNWDNDVLLGMLKHKLVHVSKVRVGDILSTDHGPVQVARIERVAKLYADSPTIEYDRAIKNKPGVRFSDAYDNDEGGGLLDDTLPQLHTHVWIIDRRALDQKACQAQLKMDRACMKQDG